MVSQADFVPISALQHYLYCPRQCALIHLERIWMESASTAEGRLLHEKAHSGANESRREIKSVTGLDLWSNELGLIGQADVVEFRRKDKAVFPVEYKRGRPKKKDFDRVQLCAQALCLEEMLGRNIMEGALFYGQTRRREKVLFNVDLRVLTKNTIIEVHALFKNGQTPPPPDEAPKCCEACSLVDECLPLISTHRQKASYYLNRLVTDL